MSAARRARTPRLTPRARRQLPAIEAALDAAAALAADAAAFTVPLAEAAAACTAALRRGRQVLFCGNGGSAAQASHLAGELSGRFYRERPAIRALALTDNTSAITAIGNDYGFDRVFERQLEAYGGAGDVLVALTTSGRSPNMRRVVRAAHAAGIATIALTGERGRPFARLCQFGFVVPSTDTARIQEIHMLLGHVLCAQVEAELFAHGRRARS
jgi:D-sedoheptulose 7-phosphate isomerase